MWAGCALLLLAAAASLAARHVEFPGAEPFAASLPGASRPLDHHGFALEIETRYRPHPTSHTLLQVEASYVPRPGVALAESAPAADTAELAYARPPRYQQPPSHFGRVTHPPYIAVTFDTEIPNGREAHRTLDAVLRILRDYQVHSTFFVVGSWARANPEPLRRMVEAGHEVANHSLTHAPFENRSPRELRDELHEVADIVLRETGTPIAPLFRPPYGCIDEPAAQLAERYGYQLAGWTASGQDALSRTHDAKEVVAQVQRNLGPGAVILLHTNRWVTAEALPTILRIIEESGWQAVTVSDLLRRDPTVATRLEGGPLHTCTTHLARAGDAPR